MTAELRPPASWRVFVALRVPRDVAARALALAMSLAPAGGAVRWVDPADIHVTLWFIGSLEAAALAALQAQLAAAAGAARPLTCRLQGAGTFGRGRERATGFGLAEPGSRRVAALAASLRGGPFRAHVTVARGAPPALAVALASRLGEMPPLAWRATSFELLRSHPGRRPAYETVAAFPLGRPATHRISGRGGALVASRS